MKWMVWLICLLWPLGALAEDLQTGAQELIAALDLEAVARAADGTGWFSESVPEVLRRLAGGQAVMSAQDVWERLCREAAGVFSKSLWRMTRLMAPALLAASGDWLREGGQGAKAARYAALMMTMALLVVDLREHVLLTTETVGKMADCMQALFPILVTLLAAVGGTASSAFYQPAVMAAAGAMTTLIQQVTMPLAVSVAVLTMVGALSDGLRVGRLCRLLRQAANWTLGLGFTVFIGVMTVQGVSVTAVDGVSIRTAKYAMDHFIPIVGGMFSDTVDTLVGCSLVVHNAVGVLGLLILLGTLIAPMLRVALTQFLYRAVSAVLEPVSDSPLCRAIGQYADVFSLLFIIELSVGAMFLVLVAQVMMVGNWTVMLR